MISQTCKTKLDIGGLFSKFKVFIFAFNGVDFIGQSRWFQGHVTMGQRSRQFSEIVVPSKTKEIQQIDSWIYGSSNFLIFKKKLEKMII